MIVRLILNTTFKNYTLAAAACIGQAKIDKILTEIGKSTLNHGDNIGNQPFFVACRKGGTAALFRLLEYKGIDFS